MIQCEYRLLNTQDLSHLVHLYKQLQPNDPELSDEVAQGVFTEITQSNHFFLLGAFQDDKLVASTYINVIPNLTRGASPYAVIENVITETALHNQGIGKALMHETLNFIWAKGCYKAMLLTGSSKESTHAFYRNCGFDGEAKSGYVAYPS